jgi:hypothetical protein
VVSTPLEHVSIASTLRTRFGIESLGPRMEGAADLATCIDPAAVQAPAPPPKLPQVELAARRSLRNPFHDNSQGELARLLELRGLPGARVDARDAAERFGSWLRCARELEAVKVIG